MSRRTWIWLAGVVVVCRFAPTGSQAQVPLSQYDWPRRWTMNPIDNEARVPGSAYAARYRPWIYAPQPMYAYASSYVSPTPPRTLIEVHVPSPHARVWFDNQPTSQ